MKKIKLEIADEYRSIMLSILIPIYNFHVVKLVKTLRQQCIDAGIVFEIICFDDRSRPKFKRENQVISSLFGVSYLELSENLGRAKIRNWLSKSANHDYLLFLDCDAEVTRKKFIKNYIPHMEGGKKVVCGGRIYSEKRPRSKKKRLHWKYGKAREELNAEERAKSPYLSFHTNNFIIQRKLFDQIKFDEEIKGYGYEDLLFAFELKKRRIAILHIDNPLKHIGLEYSSDFIDKTTNALKNLVFLHKRDPAFTTRLIDKHHMLKKYGMIPIMRKYYRFKKDKIEESLLSEDPKLRYFDLYRLFHFSNIWENSTD